MRTANYDTIRYDCSPPFELRMRIPTTEQLALWNATDTRDQDMVVLGLGTDTGMNA